MKKFQLSLLALAALFMITISTACEGGKEKRSGCTDSTATNYDPAAEVNDYSCVYPPVYSCDDERDNNYNSEADIFDESHCNEPATIHKFLGEWEFVCDAECNTSFTVNVYDHPDDYRVSLSSNFGLLTSGISVTCEVHQNSAHSYTYSYSSNGVGTAQIMYFGVTNYGQGAELRFELQGFTGNYDNIFHAIGTKVE